MSLSKLNANEIHRFKCWNSIVQRNPQLLSRFLGVTVWVVGSWGLVVLNEVPETNPPSPQKRCPSVSIYSYRTPRLANLFLLFLISYLPKACLFVGFFWGFLGCLNTLFSALSVHCVRVVLSTTWLFILPALVHFPRCYATLSCLGNNMTRPYNRPPIIYIQAQ